MLDQLKKDVEDAIRDIGLEHKPRIKADDEVTNDVYIDVALFNYDYSTERIPLDKLRDIIQKKLGSRAKVYYCDNGYRSAWFRLKYKEVKKLLNESGGLETMKDSLKMHIEEAIRNSSIPNKPPVKLKDETTKNGYTTVTLFCYFHHGDKNMCKTLKDIIQTKLNQLKQDATITYNLDNFDTAWFKVKYKEDKKSLKESGGLDNMDELELEKVNSLLESKIIMLDAGCTCMPLLESVGTISFSPDAMALLEAADQAINEGEDALKEAKKTGNIQKIKEILNKVKNYFFKRDEKSAAKILPWAIRWVARLALGSAIVSGVSAAAGLGAGAAAGAATAKGASVALALISEAIHFTVEAVERFTQNKINAKDAARSRKACEDTVKKIDKELKDPNIDQKRKNLLSIYRVRLNEFISDLEEAKTQENVINMYKKKLSGKKDDEKEVKQESVLCESVDVLQEGLISKLWHKKKKSADGFALHASSADLIKNREYIKSELIKKIHDNSSLGHSFKPMSKIYENSANNNSMYKYQEVIGSVDNTKDAHEIISKILSKIKSRRPYHYVTLASTQESGPDTLCIYILSFDNIGVDNSIQESVGQDPMAMTYDSTTLSEDVTTAERHNMKDKTFGLPEQEKYPMPDLAHVKSAIGYFGKADSKDRETLAKNIVRRTKELNGEGKVFVHKGNPFYEYAPKWLKADEVKQESAYNWGSLFESSVEGFDLPTEYDDIIMESGTNVKEDEGIINKTDREEFNKLYPDAGCSLKKDKKGYYVATHRCRSKSYPTVKDIPESKVNFVSSTS